ncbi:MAG: hypothetical protein EOO01_00900 [Chitinophagaceae bacterium]|nr:MAG: hypothetical protein EOO01_00900 [Chitinophagaceae bacterium]
MSYPLKFSLSILTFIALLVVGFMYMMRGCLSKYDERSIQRRVLYFDNKQQKIIFSIVRFEKTTSYSRSGGFINKSVSTTFHIQNNDAGTGDKISEKEIKNHRDIKNHPVEIMGASGNFAWVFMNEPMVFDPFTLATIADLSTIEAKNPSLKGKFPAERQYYRFDDNDHNLYFTAKDGSAWMIDGKTFLATPKESVEDNIAQRVKQLEKMLKITYQEQDSLMENKLRKPSRLLSAKQIDMKTYQQLMNSFSQERQLLYRKRDSLQELKNNVEKTKRSDEDIQRRINSLHDNLHFSQVKVNADTAEGRWFGLYSKEEMEELYDRFSYQSAYNERARRQWFTSTYSASKFGEIIFSKDSVTASSEPGRFLNGGLLVNPETAKPLRLDDGSFLILYRNELGGEGRNLLSRVSKEGKLQWTFDSQLKDWEYYIFTGTQLFIVGRDNKELSGDDCNILWCLDLQNGHAEKYDFFKEKKLSGQLEKK